MHVLICCEEYKSGFVTACTAAKPRIPELKLPNASFTEQKKLPNFLLTNISHYYVTALYTLNLQSALRAPVHVHACVHMYHCSL